MWDFELFAYLGNSNFALGNTKIDIFYFDCEDIDDNDDDILDSDQDQDMDGIPDHLDGDDDGDGVPDILDPDQKDSDSDGIPDAKDPDINNDGILDIYSYSDDDAVDRRGTEEDFDWLDATSPDDGFFKNAKADLKSGSQNSASKVDSGGSKNFGSKRLRLLQNIYQRKTSRTSPDSKEETDDGVVYNSVTGATDEVSGDEKFKSKQKVGFWNRIYGLYELSPMRQSALHIIIITIYFLNIYFVHA